jgi:hypothetical protein
MNHSELEAARRLLFFSLAEAAALLGGVSEQAWRRWEAGSRPIPPDVVEAVESLMIWRDSALSESLKQIEAAPDATRCALIWYSTLDDWDTLPDSEPILWRPHQSVVAQLASMTPDRTRLVAFDLSAYHAWLGSRADSSVLRSQWATEQLGL